MVSLDLSRRNICSSQHHQTLSSKHWMRIEWVLATMDRITIGRDIFLIKILSLKVRSVIKDITNWMDNWKICFDTIRWATWSVVDKHSSWVLDSLSSRCRLVKILSSINIERHSVRVEAIHSNQLALQLQDLRKCRLIMKDVRWFLKATWSEIPIHKIERFLHKVLCNLLSLV